MDGGVRSATNADLAQGHDVVLVVSVIPGQSLDVELEGLRERGARTELIRPDTASATAFGTAGLSANGAGLAFNGGALAVHAALGADGDRPGQGVEAVYGVRTGDNADLRNRRRCDQVPAHGVAEGLVDADAVDEHRDALRCAEDGRGREAAEGDVPLERIALGVVDVHARRARVQDLAHVMFVLTADRLGTDALDVGRHQTGGNANAREESRGHDLDLVELG